LNNGEKPPTPVEQNLIEAFSSINEDWIALHATPSENISSILTSGLGSEGSVRTWLYVIPKPKNANQAYDILQVFVDLEEHVTDKIYSESLEQSSVAFILFSVPEQTERIDFRRKDEIAPYRAKLIGNVHINPLAVFHLPNSQVVGNSIKQTDRIADAIRNMQNLTAN